MNARAKELQRRWSKEPWLGHLPAILDSIRGGLPLHELRLPPHEGRADLRGLALPRPATSGEILFKSQGLSTPYGLTRISERLTVKHVRLDAVDLSYSDLSYADWSGCTFRDVNFEGASVREAHFSGCAIEDSSFKRADLRGTSLGGYFGTDFNTYRGVSFAGADLRETYHRPSLFHGCDFSNADLRQVDFDGSRFVECRFVGKLIGVWFHGSYLNAPRDDLEFLRSGGIDPSGIRNPMENVDFSRAELHDVQFTDGVDISRSRFPTDDKHIVILNKRAIHDRAEAIIVRTWESGPDRDEALNLLDLLVGEGHLHRRRTEEALRRTYHGPELRNLEAANERTYAAIRGQKMTVIHRDAYDGEGAWAGRLLDLLTQLSREARP